MLGGGGEVKIYSLSLRATAILHKHGPDGALGSLADFHW